MKKVVFILVSLIANSLTAQVIELPAASPLVKVEQKVGISSITMEYSRPGVKERTIFGELVPYNEIWRTGANMNTVISLSDDITIDGKKLNAGSYSLYTIPKQDTWEIIFYTDYEGGGIPEDWNEQKIALKTIVPALKLPQSVEWLSININDFNDNGASFEIAWEKTMVRIPFNLPIDKIVSENIEKVLGGPSAEDFYLASVHYYRNDKDLTKIKGWIDKAVELSKDEVPYWYTRLQSLVNNKLGNKKEAIRLSKIAMKKAIKEGDESYANIIKDNLREWGGL